MGLRYRLKSKLEGKPDLVFSGARIVVFVSGCQWHCCPQHWVRPKSNTEFWDGKFDSNRRRDAVVNERLSAQGWKVLRFWEHGVKADCDVVAKAIRRALQGCKRATKKRPSRSGPPA